MDVDIRDMYVQVPKNEELAENEYLNKARLSFISLLSRKGIHGSLFTLQE